MPSTVFFHIGSIKTGSTNLQQFCYENRNLLLEAGIDYIQFQPPQLHLPRWANADNLLTPDFDAEHVARTIAASSAKSILISEEGLMSRHYVWQHPVFQGMRRVIILYIRNSVELVASWASENSLPYNFSQKEHASGRGVVSVDEGLGMWAAEYGAMLLGLSNALAGDPGLEVIIRPFQPGNARPKSLTEGFLQVLGCTPETIAALTANARIEPTNLGRSRKYCDAAYMASLLAKEYGLSEIYNDHFVEAIEQKLSSGDPRKVIKTLSKLEISLIQSRLLTPVRTLTGIYGPIEGLDTLPADFDVNNQAYSRIDPTEFTRVFLETALERIKGPQERKGDSNFSPLGDPLPSPMVARSGVPAPDQPRYLHRQQLTPQTTKSQRRHQRQR